MVNLDDRHFTAALQHTYSRAVGVQLADDDRSLVARLVHVRALPPIMIATFFSDV
jgi:cell division protein FtsX